MESSLAISKKGNIYMYYIYIYIYIYSKNTCKHICKYANKYICKFIYIYKYMQMCVYCFVKPRHYKNGQNKITRVFQVMLRNLGLLLNILVNKWQNFNKQYFAIFYMSYRSLVLLYREQILKWKVSKTCIKLRHYKKIRMEKMWEYKCLS